MGIIEDFDDDLTEYSITQKGLDAVDKIIRNSPQYKALLEEIAELKERVETMSSNAIYQHNEILIMKERFSKLKEVL